MFFDANENRLKIVIRILPTNECKEVLAKQRNVKNKSILLETEVMKC
jgi:hypothetical protein